jgi:YD repeat-containing protein
MVSNVSASGPGIAYAYDALGRATRMTQNGRTLSYAYDAAGNRTALAWPETTNALTANYTYDGARRRSSISRAGGARLAASYAYDAISRLSTLTQILSGSAHGVGTNSSEAIALFNQEVVPPIFRDLDSQEAVYISGNGVCRQ